MSIFNKHGTYFGSKKNQLPGFLHTKYIDQVRLSMQHNCRADDKGLGIR